MSTRFAPYKLSLAIMVQADVSYLTAGDRIAPDIFLILLVHCNWQKSIHPQIHNTSQTSFEEKPLSLPLPRD